MKGFVGMWLGFIIVNNYYKTEKQNNVHDVNRIAMATMLKNGYFFTKLEKM